MFAKYWQPGSVKTRLAQSIGSEQAAALYRTFISTTIQRLNDVADHQFVSFTPADRRQDFEQLVGPNWKCIVQADGDLGARIRQHFEQSFEAGAKRSLLIGSDSPAIPAGAIDSAFKQLEKHDVVLGPTSDGGYYLVGLRAPQPQLFESISWSTSDVLSQTIAKANSSKLAVALLERHRDVDEIEDLLHLKNGIEDTNDPLLNELLLAVDNCLKDHVHATNDSTSES